METARRNFLIQTASAAGVIGLGYLLGDRPAPAEAPGDAGRPPAEKPPCDLLKAALPRMIAENKPGVAIRIPADPQHRHTPGHLLIAALNDEEHPLLLELFAESVIVCLESDVLQDQLPRADPSHTLVLFDAQRRVVAGVALDFQDAWGKFSETLDGLLHGEGDGRLRQRAEAIRRKTDAVVLEAVDRLTGDGDRERVKESAAMIAPLLVYERRRAGENRRSAILSEILRGYRESTSRKAAGPQLPYGVEAREGAGGCGDNCAERPKPPGGAMVMVGCGMGRTGPKARSFVGYLKT